MKIKSLGLKISLIVAAMVAIIVCVIVLIVSAQSNALITELTAKEAKAANISLSMEIQNLKKDAMGHARLVANSSRVIDSIVKKDDAALKDALLELYDDIDSMTVVDTEGIAIMRVHSDQRGDSMMNQEIVATTLKTGESHNAIAKGSTIGLSTRGTAVIKDDDGAVIGAVVCGHDLTRPEYVDNVKTQNSCEVTIFDGDTRLMTTLRDENGNRGVGTKANDQAVNAVIKNKQEFQQRVTLYGREYYAHFSPLMSDNDVIGMLFTGVVIEDALKGQQAMMRTVVLVGSVCGIISVLLVFLFNYFAVSKPMKKIVAVAEMIKSGNIGVTSSTAPRIDVRSSDEVGAMAKALEQAYIQLRGYVREITDRMHDLVEGNLTAVSSYEFQGDFIMIRDSINEHVHNLNKIMLDVSGSSAQVSSGAKQVADGAQLLAQGATEQAASIDDLSSSIAEIAERTKENARIADRTSKLSSTIKDSAEKGSQQMDDMIKAVGEINDASKNISVIIKTIDDIAFQTNILALNAAVEAARAGQHGKGFAVVAEEVRNLASKSAEAAKNTGVMIQNSIEKAELGSRIAGETAASLTEIVNGINESSQLVEQIATSSEEQSSGIERINTGIDQVAVVVQQNSATAEQSAAASEEMSSQTDMLEHLISQFRLQDSGKSTGNTGKRAGQTGAQGTHQARGQRAMPITPSLALADNIADDGKY